MEQEKANIGNKLEDLMEKVYAPGQQKGLTQPRDNLVNKQAIDVV